MSRTTGSGERTASNSGLGARNVSEKKTLSSSPILATASEMVAASAITSPILSRSSWV
jgi:hypothetical protein